VIGKWLSEDPIGFSAGDPNLTRFVGNQALSHIDPNGLDEVMSLGTGRGKQEEKPTEGFDVVVLTFAGWDDLPNNPSTEFGARLVEKLKPKLGPNDIVTQKEVQVVWDKIEEEVKKQIDEFARSGRKIDVLIIIGGDPEGGEIRFESTGRSMRKGLDANDNEPGDGGTRSRNGEDDSDDRNEIPGVTEFKKSVNRAIKKIDSDADEEVFGSSDAGAFICNSGVYKLAEEIDEKRIVTGVMTHIPGATDPADPDSDLVLSGIADAIKNLKWTWMLQAVRPLL
jgi:pyrrolidone-carboxylate peptidase